MMNERPSTQQNVNSFSLGCWLSVAKRLRAVLDGKLIGTETRAGVLKRAVFLSDNCCHEEKMTALVFGPRDWRKERPLRTDASNFSSHEQKPC